MVTVGLILWLQPEMPDHRTIYSFKEIQAAPEIFRLPLRRSSGKAAAVTSAPAISMAMEKRTLFQVCISIRLLSCRTQARREASPLPCLQKFIQVVCLRKSSPAISMVTVSPTSLLQRDYREVVFQFLKIPAYQNRLDRKSVV